jgi:hypothetical protein
MPKKGFNVSYIFFGTVLTTPSRKKLVVILGSLLKIISVPCFLLFIGNSVADTNYRKETEWREYVKRIFIIY